MNRLITVSGPPGAGKTTLSRAVAGALGARLVSFDQFENITRASPEALQRWQAAGSPYDDLVTPVMMQALVAALGQGDVVFDSPIGPAGPLPQAPHLTVWIDCPSDLALCRKISQLTAEVPAGQEAAFQSWLRGYLAEYQRVAMREIAVQAARVPDRCNMRIGADVKLQDACTAVLKELA